MPGLLTQLVLVLVPSASGLGHPLTGSKAPSHPSSSGVLQTAPSRSRELILNFQETFKPVVNIDIIKN